MSQNLSSALKRSSYRCWSVGIIREAAASVFSCDTKRKYDGRSEICYRPDYSL